MPNPWKELEGQLVNGKFPLFRYLGGSEQSAVFLTERHEGGHGEGAVIKLLRAAGELADRQLVHWQRAAKLSHPQLIRLYEMGHCELAGAPLVFVVMECAEENLSQVLPSRPLAPAEAQAMLEAVLDVLAYLQREGFVHGRIQPSSILANGDQLKLSSDSLRLAGEPLDGPDSESAYDPPEYARAGPPSPSIFTPAGDIWSMGMTLIEALTQKLPEARVPGLQGVPVPPSIPEPFLDIARHCLLRDPKARWTPAQIGVRLRGRIPMPEIQSERPMPEAPDVDELPPLPAPQPAARASSSPARQRRFALKTAAGIALLLVAILGGTKIFRHHAETPQAPAAANEEPVVPAAPRQIAPTPQRQTSTPARESRLAEEMRRSKTPGTEPALAHPETRQGQETDAAARMPVDTPSRGAVIHQAAPEVLQSARNTIHGTVRVSVKVNVDRDGNVEDAELESRGPSRYFARVALEAARDWKFKPPMVGGLGVLSTWTLRFEFTRDGTNVIPTQDMP